MLIESFTINEIDKDKAYELFRNSYEESTGYSWPREKFLSRARNWTFYGDETGYVAVRKQRSGPLKLVGSAGSIRGIYKGAIELKNSNEIVWGVVSEDIAKMCSKIGMVVLSESFAGRILIKTLINFIPPEVFGNNEVNVNSDGTFNYKTDDGKTMKKVFVCNKKYFTYLTGLPAVKKKLSEIPMVSKLISSFL